jgi:hypothetical protein
LPFVRKARENRSGEREQQISEGGRDSNGRNDTLEKFHFSDLSSRRLRPLEIGTEVQPNQQLFQCINVIEGRTITVILVHSLSDRKVGLIGQHDTEPHDTFPNSTISFKMDICFTRIWISCSAFSEYFVQKQIKRNWKLDHSHQCDITIDRKFWSLNHDHLTSNLMEFSKERHLTSNWFSETCFHKFDLTSSES